MCTHPGTVAGKPACRPTSAGTLRVRGTALQQPARGRHRWHAGHQFFTAPSMIPRTICRPPMKQHEQQRHGSDERAGQHPAVDHVVAAGQVAETPTIEVGKSVPFSVISGHWKSFQATTKVSRPSTASAGRIAGSTMLQ